MSKKAAVDLTETATEQPKKKQNIEEGLTQQKLYFELEDMKRKLAEEKQLKIEAEQKLAEVKIEAEQKLAEVKIEAEQKLAEVKIEAEQKLAEVKIEAEQKLAEERQRTIEQSRNAFFTNLLRENVSSELSYEKLMEEINCLSFQVDNYDEVLQKEAGGKTASSRPSMDNRSSKGTNTPECMDFSKFRRSILVNPENYPFIEVEMKKDAMTSLVQETFFQNDNKKMKLFIDKVAMDLRKIRIVFLYHIINNLHFTEKHHFQLVATLWLNHIIQNLDESNYCITNGEKLQFDALVNVCLQKNASHPVQTNITMTGFADIWMAIHCPQPGPSSSTIAAVPATAAGFVSTSASADFEHLLGEFKSPLDKLRPRLKKGKEKDQAYCQIMGFSEIDKNKFAVGFLSDLFVYSLLFKIPNDYSVFISNNQDVLDEEHYLLYLLYSLALVKQGGINNNAFKPSSTMVTVIEEEEGQEDHQDEKEANDETANVPQAQNLPLTVVNVQQEAEQTVGQNNLVISKAPFLFYTGNNTKDGYPIFSSEPTIDFTYTQDEIEEEEMERIIFLRKLDAACSNQVYLSESSLFHESNLSESKNYALSKFLSDT
jgi:hypothetical protein